MNVNINASESATAAAKIGCRCCSLWEQCVSVYSQKNPKKNGDLQALQAIKHLSAENGILNLEAPSEFAKEWFLWRFQGAFLEIAKEIDKSIEQISVFAPQIKEATSVLPPPILKTPEKPVKTNFCKKYKLSNFIAETSNELAVKSANFIAAMPRAQENFLVIKGAAGLGKTHLLHAIGNEAAAIWAKKAVLWDSDRFFKEKRKGNLSQLYQADMLLFDDLQNIHAWENAEKDLLDILKVLKSKGQTLVVTINPKAKHQVCSELADFLKMGIKCELKKPDLQTRIAILRQKALEKGLPVEQLENSWKLIAEQLGESVCSLEGAINELAARQALLKSEITPQTVRFFYSKEQNCKVPSIESITRATALAYQIPIETLRGKSRMAQINKPRQIAIYLCRQTGLSLVEIGKFFNRDASSIVNAVQNIKKELESPNGYSLEFGLKDILNAAV